MLIACISVCMIALAGCGGNNDKPEQTKPTTKVNTVTMLKDVINNIKATYAVDKKFGTDVSVKLSVDDKTDANEDSNYQFVVKGNVDITDTAVENATDFVIEFNKLNADNSKDTLFGIAYEVIEGKPFFFINLFDGGYEKINGYSLLSILSMANGGGEASAVDITTLVAYIAPVLFGTTGNVENGVYTFDFDFANTLKQINKITPLLFGALNLNVEDIDSLVATLFKGLTYKVNGVEKVVDSFDSLIEYATMGMSVKGKVTFKFDNAKRFTSANIAFDYTNGDVNEAYTIATEKTFLGVSDTAIDTFDGFSLDADQRKAADAYNLLNFSLKGTATGLDAKKKVIHNYTIDLQADIEPFVLFTLLEDTSNVNILDTIKKLGYFHLEINEVKADGTFDKNIITLHTKTEEGFAVVNVKPYKALLYEVAVGGVYDFEALIDVIGMLTAPSDTDTDTAEDSSMNVLGLVSDMLGFFDADNMTEKGVTVELKSLVHKLLDALGMQMDGTTTMGIDAILGSDYINVKLQTPTFGDCAPVETSTIKGNIRQNKNFVNGKDSLIKEIVSLDGFTGKVFQGNTDFNSYNTGAELDKAFAIKGINLQGDTVESSGFIMAVDGLNVNKVGTQNVVVYIAVANDFLDINGILGIDNDLIPLCGVLKYNTTIEVLPFDSTLEVKTENIKTNDVIEIVENTSFWDNIRINKDTLFGKKPAYVIVGDIKFQTSASDFRLFDGEKDVTDEVIVDGNVVKKGLYTAVRKIADYKFECKVAVCGMELVTGKDVDSIKLGEEWKFSTYQIVTFDKNGNKVVAVAADAVQYKLGSTVTKLDALFDIDGDVYTLKKNLDNVGKKFTLSYKYRLQGATTDTEFKKEITIESDVKQNKPSSIYFGQSFFGKYTITIDDVKYDLVYDNDKWIAKDENGNTKDIELSLNWGSVTGEQVTLDANGFVINVPNVYKNSTRSTKIYYTFGYEGYYYSGNFTYYELSASDKTNSSSQIPVGTNFNGKNYITNVNYITNIVDGEQVNLEFRYETEGGYGLYYKSGESYVKVYDVNVKATNTEGGEVTLVDGAFTEAGTYKIEYDLTVNGINQKFYHNVTVKA